MKISACGSKRLHYGMCAVLSVDTALAHDYGFVSHKDTLEETNTLYKNIH